MIAGVHEAAEKYLSLAVSKVAECDAVRVLTKIACLVAAALVLQVVILVYVAFRLTTQRL